MRVCVRVCGVREKELCMMSGRAVTWAARMCHNHLLRLLVNFNVKCVVMYTQ